MPVSGVRADSRGSRTSRARLGGALNPLSSRAVKQRGKKKSHLFGSSGLFLNSLPASCGALTPSGCVHAPTPVLSLRSDRSPSLSSQLRPPAGEQTSLSGWWVLLGTNPPCGNLSAVPSAPLWLRSPPWLRSFPPLPPAVSAREGAPSVWKPFFLHSSLPLVQVLSLFFCLSCFFFLLPYPGTWGVSCLLGGLKSSASVQ